MVDPGAGDCVYPITDGALKRQKILQAHAVALPTTARRTGTAAPEVARHLRQDSVNAYNMEGIIKQARCQSIENGVRTAESLIDQWLEQRLQE
jgi:hypothetical protein